jgi:hypothetical protein
MVIGLFIGTSLTPATSSTAIAPATTAAPLTQDQLNGGQLPAGHPAITGSGSSTTATATK